MKQNIGYLDNKSIGYLDSLLLDNTSMSDTAKYPEFSKRLSQVWRECKGAPEKQTQLAKWLGFAQPTVNNWINGNALPGLETAVILADKFDCNPIWLITGNGSKYLKDIDNTQASPLLEKFNALLPDQQKLIELMLDQLSQNSTQNKPLTPPTENVGGGG
jgi:DNA-binding XRE family transcriptional regulator